MVFAQIRTDLLELETAETKNVLLNVGRYRDRWPFNR